MGVINNTNEKYWLTNLRAIATISVIMLINEFVLFYFTGYIGYYLLGYYIAFHLPMTRAVIISGAVIFLVGWILTVSGTYFSSVNKRGVSSSWYEYLMLNVAFMAAGIFILARASQQLTTFATTNKLFRVISEHSLGIYLIHVLVLELLAYFKIDYAFIHPLIGIPVTAGVCLAIALLVVLVISKVPFGKRISG